MSASNSISPLRTFPLRQQNFPLCLAPMVGLSHVATRLVLRQYLPEGARTIWPTEMLSSRRLPHERVGQTPETLRGEFEQDLVPQILGNEEEEIARSVVRLEQWGASGIDINMGCPVKKALKHNYGVALMGDAKYAAKVVRMTRRHTCLPISVKLRAGLQGDLGYLLDFAQGLVEAGASWLVLHPRTAEQQRRGQADWEQIRKLREHVSVPVIGNGDIQIVEDVHRMRSETGCDLVMIGRALLARPWLFWQWGEEHAWPSPPRFAGRRAPRTPLEEGAEYGRVLVALTHELESFFEPSLALRKLRFYIRMSSFWLEFGHSLNSLVNKAKNMNEVRAKLLVFFESPQSMQPRTELRY